MIGNKEKNKEKKKQHSVRTSKIETSFVSTTVYHVRKNERMENEPK